MTRQIDVDRHSGELADGRADTHARAPGRLDCQPTSTNPSAKHRGFRGESTNESDDGCSRRGGCDSTHCSSWLLFPWPRLGDRGPTALTATPVPTATSVSPTALPTLPPPTALGVGTITVGRHFIDIQGYRYTFDVGHGWHSDVGSPDVLVSYGDEASSDFALLHLWGRADARRRCGRNPANGPGPTSRRDQQWRTSRRRSPGWMDSRPLSRPT